MSSTEVNYVRVTTTVELLGVDGSVLAQARTTEREAVPVWSRDNLKHAARTGLDVVQRTGERANVGAFAALTGGKH